MPRKLVLQAWCEQFGDDQPRIIGRDMPRDVEEHLPAVARSMYEMKLSEFVLPFAFKFLVSRTAMRIRLEKLGLLQREVPAQRSVLARA